MNYFDLTGTPQYSQFIHVSRYSRWLDDKNRRETWEETVDRYINFWCERYPKLKKEILPLREYILTFKVMPSMRCLMTAGKALEKDNVAGFNCLSGDTLVTTKEYGIIPISTVAGKRVHVVDGKGEWVEASCNYFGKKSLYRVHFVTSGKGSFYIDATKDHRWILDDFTEKSTVELKNGDRCATTKFSRLIIEKNEDYYNGVKHGLVYGDGTANYRIKQQKKLCKGFVIRLCMDQRDLLPYFKGNNISYPPSFNGQPVVYLFTDDSAIDLKQLPDLTNNMFTDSYLLGFIRGWFAADGSVSSTSLPTLATNELGLKWVYEAAVRTGFVPRSYRKQSNTTNFGERSEDSFIVSFDRRYLIKDDFIIKRKADRFNSLEGFVHSKIDYVEDLAKEENVYCFSVPTTRSFLLHRNILTGNCAFIAVDHPRAFDEAMYILMCGTGLGFSVERQFINKLPDVPEQFFETETVINVRDSKIGWATGLKELISLLYNGQIPKWDLSKLRPAGARLKTFGGRSSGPEPLDQLFHFTINLFKRAVGRKLTSLECHDLMCKIGEVVVVGGVRRSALLSLSNPSDDRMREAKTGQWWVENAQRALANNSACYTEKPDFSVFLKEWKSLYDSKCGERGFFSRYAAQRQAIKTDKRNPDLIVGSNPCNEILLRSAQFCNLSEVVVRSEDTLEDLLDKVRVATIFGTLQATLTDFRYLRAAWKQNTEEEALLGVSLTGIMDHALLSRTAFDDVECAPLLVKMKEEAIRFNEQWADKLGINKSVAITCVKPSGTVSQLVNSASGIHPRYSEYYVRTVRNDVKDPVTKFLQDSGVPWEPDVMNPNAVVFSFPIKSPESSKVKTCAIEQLELWSTYNSAWCEHKPSCTVYYTDDDFLDVGNWLWNNFNEVSGVSFLPYSDHVYKQAPYQPITKEKYEELVAKMPVLDWSKLPEYEKEDNTTSAKELACTGNICELS